MAVLNYHYHGHPEGAVNIMRPSRWGNPFVIGRHGTREQVIAGYRQYLWQLVHEGFINLRDLASLHGRDLICCCKPAACHGDVLEEAAEWAHAVITEEKKDEKAVQ